MLVPLSAFGAALIAAYWYIYSSTPNAITNTLDSATLRYKNVFTALAPLIFGRRDANNYQRICEIIAFNISSESAVHYPGSKSYDNNIYHWASSGTQQSACSVEPGSTEDVGRILRILGATLTPFGVKSGGHMVNPGSSSTPGVEIALTRFNKVKYNPTTQTVEFGSGLVFDDVYTALEPYNVSVAGARVSRIGVGGFMLGGGYSWKTNEYGLAIDNTLAYELVKPDGNVVKVTESSDSELFFGLKGGFNNFGIVTQFTMNALPQPSIWAGTISYPPSSVSEVTKAIIKFCENSKDPKANIAFAYNLVDGKPTVSGFVYYDGPSPPPGLFDDFLKIPAVSQSVHERSLMDFIKEANLNAFIGLRGIFNTVPLLKTSPSIMEVILNETTFWGEALAPKAEAVVYTIEPFISSILSHNATPSAYPPTRDHVYSPLNLNFVWQNATYDNEFHDAIRQSTARIRDAAIRDGQDIVNAPIYPNYAIFGTSLRSMYGDNVEKLASLRRRVDPLNVMGLAGGFKF